MKTRALRNLPIALTALASGLQSAGAQVTPPGFPSLPGFQSATPTNLLDLNYYQNWAAQGGVTPRTSAGGFGTSRFNQLQYGSLPRSIFFTYPNCANFGPQFGNGFIPNGPFGQGWIGLNGARFGYYHYNANWNDNWFFFPYYSFSPLIGGQVFPSPWYPYVSLPPYVSGRAVMVLVPVFLDWQGIPYGLGTNRGLDESLQRIVGLYQSGDRRQAERLIPRRNRVDIVLDGDYKYSLRPNDFEGLFLDGVMNSRTRSYRIEDVQFRGSVARVRARHEYIDPWGEAIVTFHDYVLEEERRQFVVRQFGVSKVADQ